MLGYGYKAILQHLPWTCKVSSMASGTVRPGEKPAEPPPIKPVSDPLHERRRLHPITRLPILNKILAKEVRTNGGYAVTTAGICVRN